jgi:hypothetical protein
VQQLSVIPAVERTSLPGVQKRKRKSASKSGAIEWHGLDTETVDGRAVLICTESRALEWPKTWAEIVDWLTPKPVNHYVCWNQDYDARAMIAILGILRLKELNLRTRTEWGPVARRVGNKKRKNLRRYSITYLPRKELVIRYNGCRSKDDRIARVYDAFCFYQVGLDKAAKEILGIGKDEIPEEWYEDFGAVLRGPERERAINYCKKDARLALQLHDNVRLSFEKAGIPFTRPLSPGYCAGQYFKGRTVRADHDHNRVTNPSFYGARIEIWQRGHIGACVQYDIRSAYPSVLAQMQAPALAQRTDKETPGALYGAYLVELETSLPLLPYRHRPGAVIFPVGTWCEWYSKPDLELLRRYSVPYRVLAAWESFPAHGQAGRLLFPELPEWFERRFEHDSDGNRIELRPGKWKESELSLAYKSSMNSLFGKTAAQTPKFFPRTSGRVRATDYYHAGQFWRRVVREGGLTNFMLAAHITASCRARVTEAALLDPSNVVLLATDGIIFRGAGPAIECGPNLGAWELKARHADGVVIGAGVYEMGGKVKSRGFRPRRKKDGSDPPTLTELLTEATDTTWLKTPGLRGDTLAEAFRRRDFRSMARLRKIEQRKDVNADNKRAWPSFFKSGADVLNVRHTSAPWLIVESADESRARLKAQKRWPKELR